MSFTNAQLAQQIADLITYWSSFNQEYSDWLGGTVDGGPGSDGKYPLTNWAGAESLVDSPAKLADNVSGYVGLASASEAAAAASAAAAATSESNASTSAATATAQAALADADRVAAELAEANALSSQTVATTQANLATDRAGYAQEWAITVEDTLVSVAAGGNGTTDYSALHWAAKSAGSASAASTSETNAAASAAAAAASAIEAATFNPALYAALADNETVTGQYTFSHASGILIGAAPLTATLIGQWNTAYSWGDHAGLYSLVSHNHAGVYEPADATILKDADIGVTVAAFSHSHIIADVTGLQTALDAKAALAGNTFTGNHTFNDGFQIGDSAGRVLVNDTGDGGTRLYMAGRNAGNTDWNWGAEFGWDQANQYWYCDTHIRMQGGLYPALLGYAPANTPDNYLYINRNNVNPALYVMKDSTTGGPVAKFGSGTMNSTTFGGGAFEIQADGGFTASGAATISALLTADGLDIQGNADVNGTLDILGGTNGNTHFNYSTGQNYITHLTGNFTRVRSYDGVSAYTTIMEFDNSGILFAGNSGRLKDNTVGTYSPLMVTGTKGSYGGISLDGYFTWMNSGSSHIGLYNDINNEWMILAYPNGLVRLYYNGIEELATVSGGITIGDTNKSTLTNVGGGYLRVTSAYGYTEIGPNNASWAHFNTDRANFYFNKGVSFNGVPKYYNQGAIAWHGSSSYASHKVTFSTSAATGGSSGDIWYQYS